jgi:chromosome segregation ATPase
MSSVCEFCNKTFLNIYTLNTHQKTTKKCLAIQGKMKQQFIIEEDLQCYICEKILSTKQTLNNHIMLCKEKNSNLINTREIKKLQEENMKIKLQYQNLKDLLQEKNLQIKNKDIQIKELQNTVKEALNKALEQPTNVSTYNNNSTNYQLAMFNVTPENTTKILKDKLKREHLYYGMGGFADFAKEHLLTLENGEMIYKCFDVSRQIFKYVDNNGVLIKDVKAKKLMGLIREPVVLRILEIINDYNKEYEELNKEIYDMNTDSRELRKKIEKIDYYRKEALKLKTDINLMEENNKFAIELSTRLSE